MKELYLNHNIKNIIYKYKHKNNLSEVHQELLWGLLPKRLTLENRQAYNIVKRFGYKYFCSINEIDNYNYVELYFRKLGPYSKNEIKKVLDELDERNGFDFPHCFRGCTSLQ